MYNQGCNHQHHPERTEQHPVTGHIPDSFSGYWAYRCTRKTDEIIDAYGRSFLMLEYIYDGSRLGGKTATQEQSIGRKQCDKEEERSTLQK